MHTLVKDPHVHSVVWTAGAGPEDIAPRARLVQFILRPHVQSRSAYAETKQQQTTGIADAAQSRERKATTRGSTSSRVRHSRPACEPAGLVLLSNFHAQVFCNLTYLKTFCCVSLFFI